MRDGFHLGEVRSLYLLLLKKHRRCPMEGGPVRALQLGHQCFFENSSAPALVFCTDDGLYYYELWLLGTNLFRREFKSNPGRFNAINYYGALSLHQFHKPTIHCSSGLCPLTIVDLYRLIRGRG